MKVTVLTVEGRPTFFIKVGIGPQKIAERIKKEYGLQPDGSPHQWRRERVVLIVGGEEEKE